MKKLLRGPRAQFEFALLQNEMSILRQLNQFDKAAMIKESRPSYIVGLIVYWLKDE